MRQELCRQEQVHWQQQPQAMRLHCTLAACPAHPASAPAQVACQSYLHHLLTPPWLRSSRPSWDRSAAGLYSGLRRGLAKVSMLALDGLVSQVHSVSRLMASELAQCNQVVELGQALGMNMPCKMV